MTTVQRPATPGAAEGGGLRRKLINLVLKPDPARPDRAATDRRTVGELEEVARSANDKERLVGLLAAPFAAAIGLLVYGALTADDPPAYLKDGLADSKHVALSLYADLLGVLLVLSVVMLVTAWFRKRLFLGCAMALYGLAIFNLHYWGFGVPYVLFGAWLIVRAYRAQRDLREATAAKAPCAALATTPSPSRRYTPPGSRRRPGRINGASGRGSPGQRTARRNSDPSVGADGQPAAARVAAGAAAARRQSLQREQKRSKRVASRRAQFIRS